jgi:hypothetical protein
MPSISSIQLNHANINNNENLKTGILDFFIKISKDPAPKWFTFFYYLIMLSLNLRIVLVTPFAVKPGGEYWWSYEVNSYFFCLILLTLVYRFAFWYNLFDRILEKNNWERP